MQGSKGDRDVQNILFNSVKEGEGGKIWENSSETCILPCRWPVQVRYLKQGTQSQCSGTTQRDKVGREMEVGFRIRGTHISSVQLLSRVQLFVTPWTAAHQASLSITNSQSLLKLMCIELVMPSNHLALCRALLLPPLIFPRIRVF